MNNKEYLEDIKKTVCQTKNIWLWNTPEVRREWKAHQKRKARYKQQIQRVEKLMQKSEDKTFLNINNIKRRLERDMDKSRKG